MTSAPVTPAPEAPPLSEPQRIIDTFVAPSKTFTDIRRSAAWWGPFLVAIITTLIFVYSVDTKVGFRKVTEHQIENSPRATQRMEQLSRAERDNAIAGQTKITRGISYGYWLIVLLWNLLIAAVLFGTFKFALNAEMTFSQTFAVVMYAGLALSVRGLLAVVMLFAGLDPDSFNMQNPAPSNPGYFLSPSGSPFLYSFASSIDIFMIWTLVLTALGISIISKKTKFSTALIVVFGWYAVFALTVAGIAAAVA
jgi:Yip1-like protein